MQSKFGTSALSHRVPKIQLNGMKLQINITSYQEAVLQSKALVFRTGCLKFN